MAAALAAAIVMTVMSLFVILGSTDKRAPQGLGPLAIGLCLTRIHLISAPAAKTLVNPVRSTGVAIFVCGWVVRQLCLFRVAPIVGAIPDATIYRFVGGEQGQCA